MTEGGSIGQADEARGPKDLTVLPPNSAAWFTIIVPTRNEEGSVRPLLSSLAESLKSVTLFGEQVMPELVKAE